MRRKGPIRRAGASEAARIVSDNAISLSQERELCVPHSPIEVTAMKKYHGSAATSRLIVEGAAVDHDAPRVDCCDGGVRRRTRGTALARAGRDCGEQQEQQEQPIGTHCTLEVHTECCA